MERLSEHSGVPVRSIRRYEEEESIPPNRKGNLDTLVQTFSDAGITFTGDPETDPGVTLDRARHAAWAAARGAGT